MARKHKDQHTLEYSIEWKEEFAQLMKDYKGFIIARLLKRFPGIVERHGIDDYYQESCIAAYRLFHRFKALEYTDFGRWLFKVIDYAVLGYINDQSIYQKRNWHTDKNFIYDLPVEEYEDDEAMEAMMRAINELSEQERSLVDLVLSGEDLSKHSLNAGLSKGNYTKRFELIKRKLHARVKEILPISTRERMFNTAGRGKGVLQIHPDTGQIKEWPNMLSAVREGWSAHQILRVLKGQQDTYRGWFWRRPEEKKTA